MAPSPPARSTATILGRAATAVTGLAWLAFWFWALSFAFSSSFFVHHPHTRIPHFLAGLVCVVVLPVSAWLHWGMVRRGRRTARGALVGHAVSSLVALAPPFLLTAAFSRATGAWRLEADEAMGVGIANALLLAVAAACALALATALGVRRWRARGGRPA